MDIVSTSPTTGRRRRAVWPHKIQAGPKGRTEKQVLSFDKIEVNPPIEDTRFKMPSR
jgi:hypothetical protein